MLCHSLTEPEFSFTTRFHAFTGASVMLFVILQRLGSGGIAVAYIFIFAARIRAFVAHAPSSRVVSRWPIPCSDMSTHDIVHVDAVQDKVYLQLVNLGLSIT